MIDRPERILIVKLSAIGDVLMATPVARALRKAFPEARIEWVVEKKAADIVLGNPYLDDVVVWERTNGKNGPARTMSFLRGLSALSRELRSRRFDVCLDLQGLMRSAIVCAASGSKRRIGFADAAEGGVLFYHEKYDPSGPELNAQQRNLDILKTIGVESTETAMHMPVMDDDRAFAADLFERERLNGQTVVAFCPATTWVNKHWVPEGWSGVSELLSRNHNARTVILGSKADLALAERIVGESPAPPVVFAGQTTLKQAGAVMERCAAVIGVDTGLLHMSVALDRPTVGLFGASAWRCFQQKDNFVWVAKEFPCSPCQRHPICDNIDCMRAITPEDVLSAVSPWLDAKPSN